jgi:hypothetical protein
MKPVPRRDFPVGITAARNEHPEEAAEVMAGIYTVLLNHTISVEIVPQVDRWPPDAPYGIDVPVSSDEARRAALWAARYAVTPDPVRAGAVERLSPDPDSAVVFFVEPAEFDAILAECAALEEGFAGIHSAKPVSALGDSRLARFLLDRLIPSGYLSEYQRKLLGQT